MLVTTKTQSEITKDFPMTEQLMAIFCDIDDFCKEYEKYCANHLLTDEQKLPKTSMELSYIMTIVVFFTCPIAGHSSGTTKISSVGTREQ